MFDFDIGKLMVVAIVALAVIPPKDLPRVMRTVGQVVGKMRRMAAEFQGQFMDAMREADLENVRKELEALNEKAKVDASFDPAGMIRDEVTKAAAPLEVGTSEVALNPPQAPPPQETPARIEADLESVRKELEALNEKAVIREEATKATAPHEVGTSEVALNAPQPAPLAHGPPPEVEAPAAKQSAAE
jgi:sec-independent protein translocase protein TatB